MRVVRLCTSYARVAVALPLTAMATADLESIRATLRQARDDAAARVEEFTDVVRRIAQSRGDADTDDEHDPEGSTLSWDRAAQDASAEAARAHLAEIDAALSRIDAGWDGTCSACGRPIPPARLAARPSAERCVACASSPRQ